VTLTRRRPDDSRAARLWTCGAVAFCLFLVFNSNLRSINSIDTAAAQHTALALARTGRADLALFPGLVKNGIADGYIRVVDGRPYSSYPLLPALLAAPAYRVAIALDFVDVTNAEPWRVETIGALVASTFVALACGIVFLVVAGRHGNGPAALVAIACGLATPLWSSASQALWSHAPAVLLLAAGLGLLMAAPAGARERPRLLLIAGAALTLAVFCRQLLIVFPACAALALWRSQAPRSCILMFIAGSALAAGTMVTTNLLLLGSPLGALVELYVTGVTTDTHAVASAWSGNWLAGLAGVFVSPSRGLMIYMPIVLVAMGGAAVAWRDPLARYGLVLPTVLYLVLWSKYAVWWSGHSFGPRFAADLAVPFALLAAGTVAYWAASTALTRMVTTAALAWSVMIQAVGAFAYPAGDWNGLPLNVDLTHDRLWDWRDSQLIRTVRSGTYRHYRAMQQRNNDPLAETETIVEIDQQSPMP